jgi:hypothetical protein
MARAMALRGDCQGVGASQSGENCEGGTRTAEVEGENIGGASQDGAGKVSVPQRLRG